MADENMDMALGSSAIPVRLEDNSYPLTDEQQDGTSNAAAPMEDESYFHLVWRRFRRSPVSIVGGMMVLMLVLLAVFADFFTPTPLGKIDLNASFTPPQ